jgi:hypothetical protein
VDLYWILKWQGSFPKNKEVVQKQKKQTRKETRPKCSNKQPTLPENLFSKENYMEKESKENLRRGYSKYYKRICFRWKKIVFLQNGTFKNSNRISFLINFTDCLKWQISP